MMVLVQYAGAVLYGTLILIIILKNERTSDDYTVVLLKESKPQLETKL
jgi:hypothetical protein